MFAASFRKISFTREAQLQAQNGSANQLAGRGVRWSVPLILDKYVIAGFLKYFLLVLCSFVIIFIVFTFFELLEDVVANQTPDSGGAELLSLPVASNRLLYAPHERPRGRSR